MWWLWWWWWCSSAVGLWSIACPAELLTTAGVVYAYSVNVPCRWCMCRMIDAWWSMMCVVCCMMLHVWCMTQAAQWCLHEAVWGRPTITFLQYSVIQWRRYTRSCQVKWPGEKANDLAVDLAVKNLGKIIIKTRRYVLYVFYNLLEKRINTRISFFVKRYIRYSYIMKTSIIS